MGTWQQLYYDGTGNRLKATRVGVTTYYIYDAAGRLLAEADSSKNITRYYIYGAGLLAMVTAATPNQVFCYHFNPTGSTIAITNQNGVMVNKYAYDPFGNILGKEESIPQPFKFIGQFGVMYEYDLGFYYMKARYYSPSLGRFISEDPIGFAGGDVNLCAYVGNNPINQIDPFGLIPPKDIPPNVDMLENINKAQDMSSFQFYQSVKIGGIWDYKTLGSKYQDFGNYHFGAVGMANGWSPEILKRASGL